MTSNDQSDLLSSFSELDLVKHLLADLHDDLPGKIARSRQLVDLSESLGTFGTMMFGGETSYCAWREARRSFIHGNFMATILLCQALAEHTLAAFLHAAALSNDLPQRISFSDTLKCCRDENVVSAQDAEDLRRLMNLRNPLSHFRNLSDPGNLSRRALSMNTNADDALKQDACFAMGLATRILALPHFRIGQ
jgi:hypothetical protein